jgi:hypothetical protein
MEARLITFAEEVRQPKIKFWTLTSQALIEPTVSGNSTQIRWLSK